MRLLTFTLVLLAAPASAQSATEPVSLLLLDATADRPVAMPAHERPGIGPQLVMMTGGVLTSFGLLELAGSTDRAEIFLLSPVASAATVYALGEILGYDGDPLYTLGGAALGALPGVVMIGAGLAMDRGADPDALVTDGAILVVLGALVYAVGPGAGAAGGYALTPTVVAPPEGEPAPGLSLRIGL